MRAWKELVWVSVIAEAGWLSLCCTPPRFFCIAPRNLAVGGRERQCEILSPGWKQFMICSYCKAEHGTAASKRAQPCATWTARCAMNRHMKAVFVVEKSVKSPEMSPRSGGVGASRQDKRNGKLRSL